MGAFKQLATGLQELIDEHGIEAVMQAASSLLKCKCAKCGKTWTPRGGAMPAMCPACKSIRWNKGGK